MPTSPAGRTYEFPMHPPDRLEVALTPEDREFYHNIGGDRFLGHLRAPGRVRRRAGSPPTRTARTSGWRTGGG